MDGFAFSQPLRPFTDLSHGDTANVWIGQGNWRGVTDWQSGENMARTESIAMVTAVCEALPCVVGRKEGEEEGSMVAKVVT